MEVLTELQTLLAATLTNLKLDDGAILCIMLALESEEMQVEMAHYLVNHRNATQEELLKVATEISGGTVEDELQ